ncbi:MAG: hypothetical protein NTV31_12585 [Bacteroidia bacterium]|nr:hypothetical protein [Bacteroidia bacterium]
MMRKIIKNIPGFFLLFAGLAINAHMIIPHDHHIMESVASQDDTCPVSNNKTDHHTGFPVHCHAFNDLTAEKAITYVQIKEIQCKDYVRSSFFDLDAFIYQFSGRRNFDIGKPPFNSDIPELSPLRAPPSIS